MQVIRLKMKSMAILFILAYYCLGWCLKQTIAQTGTNVFTVDYSPDGTMIATGGMNDNSAHIYDAVTYTLKVTIPVGSVGSSVNSLKFSPNSAVLAIGYKNGALRFYTIATAVTATLNSGTTSQSIMNSMDWTTDSTYLATCSNSNNVLKVFSGSGATWTVTAGYGGYTVTGQNFMSCVFTFDNNLLAASTNGSVFFFPSPYTTPTAASTVSYSSGNSNGGLTCISYRWQNVTGTYNYILGNDGKTWMYTSASTNNFATGGSLGCDYARTLDYFVFGGGNNKLFMYNGTSNSNAFLFQYSYSQNVQAADFSNDANFLVVGVADGNAYVYSQICTTCDSYSYFNWTTKTCKNCSGITGCGGCYNSTTCYTCFQGYYLSAGTCTACTSLAGCTACVSATNCTSPTPGYYLNVNTPTLCAASLPGCQICNTSANCFECYSEYYLSGGTSGTCVSCLNSTSYCLKCLNSTYCVECIAGYYPLAGASNTQTCSKCATNCIDCINLATCLSCAVGFYANAGGSCVTCPSGCLACNNTGICIDCMVGMWLNSAGTCSNCTAPCLVCVTSATTCLTCRVGFYFDGTSACTACPSPCQTCNLTTGACLTCVQGYFFSAGTCTACTPTYANCQACTPSVCSICYTGYYPDTTTSCKSCAIPMHGCLSCNTSSNCFFCAAGHYLNTSMTANNSCQPCPQGCTTCENLSNCTSCSPGFFYSSPNCNRCTGLCTTCTSSATTCSSCVLGYYLTNAATGTCGACNVTIAGCVACIVDSSSNMNCTECSLGQYLTATGSCASCTSPCLSCSSTPTACLSCPAGNYLNTSDSTCRSCSPYCTTCSANGTCSSCVPGSYLAGSSCTACPSPCVSCDSTPKCLSCISGYFYISSNQTCNICTASISNCLLCNSSAYCYQCAYGYTLSATNNSCTSCSAIAGCYHCTSPTLCLSCQSGYFLNGSLCSPCSQGCMVCNSSSYCLSCATTYFYGNILGGANNGLCLRCVSYLSGCGLCSNNTDCSQCVSGYFMGTSGTNSVCKLCETSISYCQVCNSSTICTSCKGGYYLAADSLSCIQCSTTFPSCQLCNRLGTACTNCLSGYYINSGNCVLCSNNLNGCQICNGSSSCVQCQSGYYLSGGTCHLCQSSIPGCIFCSSSAVCQSCDSGYYLNTGTSKCSACAVVGCQVCQQNSPTACVTCNSLYYKSSATACSLCHTNINNCLTCSDSATCTKCDVGYYLDSSVTPPVCKLCSSAIQGCSICSSSTTCLQCKSMYFLNSTSKCQLCSQSLTGCVFCTNTSTCLSCGSGYFINSSSLCSPCTSLTGCLVCKNSSTCLFCDTGYYFNNYQCSTCNIITGCYSCISNTICTSCVGGYTLNTNSGCDVTQVSASLPTTDLILKTMYLNADTLKHYLYVKGKNFTKATVDWNANAKLTIKSTNGTSYTLTIKSVEWPKQNNYTIIFYTNNPINYTASTNKMPFARRLLDTTLDLSNFKTGIQLSDAASLLILPDYQHSGSLLVDYPLSSPEFYQSYIAVTTVDFPFFIIGAVITGILFFKYLLKALATVPKSPNIGNIIPHILAFKVGALLLYPTYIEYINYCTGFMYADFPWLNKFFGSNLSDGRDYSPQAYSIFYSNMNLASMYLLALSIIVVLSIIGVLVGKSCGPKYDTKMYAFFAFLYNFFVFGAAFAGCASLQGAVLNPITSLTINGAFYIIGILLYFSLICECIYKISQDKALNFWKVRVLLKATLLSLSHLSPIYLLSSTVVIDLVLIIVQYQLAAYPKQYPKSWIFANIIVNLSLILMVFLPIILLTLVLVSVFLVTAIVAQAIMHYLETRTNIVIGKLDSNTNNSKQDQQRNVWDINVNEINQKYSLKKTMESSFDNFKGTKDSKFIMTKYTNNSNLATMYPKQTDKGEEDTQNLGLSKYKRQRNFKKARQNQQNKLLHIQQADQKNQTYNQSSGRLNQKKTQPNLTFMIEDVLNKE